MKKETTKRKLNKEQTQMLRELFDLITHEMKWHVKKDDPYNTLPAFRDVIMSIEEMLLTRTLVADELEGRIRDCCILTPKNGDRGVMLWRGVKNVS
jgi:hypothetical protein